MFRKTSSGPAGSDIETSMNSREKDSWFSRLVRDPLFWIALIAAPVFFWGLDSPALSDGEAMYGEIPREMRESGDWITPHLNGNRHFDKPPLLYWLICLSQIVMGETEASARIWPALASWATLLVTGSIGRALYGRLAGSLCALVFATCLGPFLFGRLAMPEPVLVFCTSLAVLGYVRGFRLEKTWAGPWPWIMFASVGVGSLTKGVLGIALPAAIIGLHLVIVGRLRDLWSSKTLLGLGLTAMITAPWHVAVSIANPDFLGYYIIREHFLRYTGARYPPDEVVPLGIFLFLTLMWMFPWFALFPQALIRGIKRLLRSSLRASEDLLPLIWGGVVMLLFCTSQSRLEYYSLSAMPAFALLIGKLWSELIEREPGAASPRTASCALGAMAMIFVLSAGGVFAILGPHDDTVFRFFALAWPETGWTGGAEQVAVLNQVRIPAIATMTGIALFAASSFTAMWLSKPSVACGILAAMMLPLLAMVHWGFQLVEPYQSSRPVAEIILRAPPAEVLVFEDPYEYMWIGGPTFYLKRMVHILKNPKFDGVTARRREPPERFLDRERLVSLWGSDKRVILVADRKKLDLFVALDNARRSTVIGRSGNWAVVGNWTAPSPAAPVPPPG